MFSPRRLRLLPPHVLMTISQHLDPVPVRFRPLAPYVREPNRAKLSSFLSRIGVNTREEKFKLALEQAIEQARNPQSWSSFPTTYNRLLSQYRVLNRTGDPPSFLSQSLGEIMLNLTRTRTPNRVVDKFVASIFLDIKRGEWKIPLGTDHYLAMIRSRAQAEDFEAAEEYLQECLESFAFSAVPSRVFIALLGEYRRYNDYESVWRVYSTLKAISPVQDKRVYDLVQDVMMSSPMEFLQDHILELQSDYERAQLGPVPRLSLLLATFVALGQESEAKDASQKLRKVLQNGTVIRYSEQRGWEALIRYSFAAESVDATKDVMKAAKKLGYRPLPSLLHRIILDHKIATVERLRDCEEALSLEADTVAWTLVIHQSLAVGGIDAAITTYQQSKQAGIVPAAYTLHPLIRALCGGHLRKDLTWDGIDQALRLYDDLLQSVRNDRSSKSQEETDDSADLESAPVSFPLSKDTANEVDMPSSPNSKRWSPARVWPGPDSMIYDTLLRGISQLARNIYGTQLLPEPQRIADPARPFTVSTIEQKPSKELRSKEVTFTRGTLWDHALKLLDDMRQLNVPSSPMSTTAIIILSMRIAPTFHGAFQVYRAMAHGEQLRNKGTLSEGLDGLASMGGSQYFNQFELTGNSYENIIRAFCTLKPIREGGVLTYPPADLYLEMVKDMQLAGHGITEDVYMTFLYRLGRQARSLRLWDKQAYPYSMEDEAVEGGADLEDLDPNKVGPETFLSTRHSILHGIRTMHNHIALNAGITPSVDLLNAMLDAYNKVAAVHDAFKVWDTIFLSRIYDTKSVSIILDTCGWAKVGHKASQIWNQLVAREFVFNKNNWDSRVECLCRLGKLDDALKVVCLEMPTQNKVNAKQREQARAARGPILTAEGKVASKIAARALLDAEERENDITPDAKTLGVLFSFATQTNQVVETRTRVARYLPDVWNSIPVRQRTLWTSLENDHIPVA